jgi:hypothetical protein
VEEVLVVRKTGNYVTYISARVPYVHMISSSRSRVEEARPRKERKLLAAYCGRPGFPTTLHRTVCSTEGDEGDLSEALQQRGKHIHGKDCKYTSSLETRVLTIL